MVADATKNLAVGTSAKVAEAGEAFGWKLLREVGTEDNVLISPLSIATALSMAMNGAQGETQREMREALGVGKLTPAQINDASRTMGQLLVNADPKVTLRIANSIWAKQDAAFKDTFLKTNEDAYGARVERIDFSDGDKAKETMNAWVKGATEGKIPSVVDMVTPDHRMFLINAVYFRGLWSEPFRKEATEEAEFTKPDGSKTKVAMMSTTQSVGYHEDKAYRAVSLPYGNKRLELVVILPTGKDEDFRKVMASGAAVPRAFKSQEIAIKLPKFRIEASYDLNEPLKKLGMKLAFTDRADFSALSAEKLLVSAVKHKTFMEVDESGTEAAAATSVEVAATSAPMEPKSFVVDRPFYLALRERETGIVLFLGFVGAPR